MQGTDECFSRDQKWLCETSSACVGDWYNKLDWNCKSNNFGVGLAPGSKNNAAWPLHKPRLVSELQPSANLIKLCRHATV